VPALAGDEGDVVPPPSWLRICPIWASRRARPR